MAVSNDFMEAQAMAGDDYLADDPADNLLEAHRSAYGSAVGHPWLLHARAILAVGRRLQMGPNRARDRRRLQRSLAILRKWDVPSIVADDVRQWLRV